jgi:hypothetical protein
VKEEDMKVRSLGLRSLLFEALNCQGKVELGQYFVPDCILLLGSKLNFLKC